MPSCQDGGRPVRCENCNFTNSDDNKFCIMCGAPLGGGRTDEEEVDASSSTMDLDASSLLSESQVALLEELDELSLDANTPSSSSSEEDIDLLLSDFEGSVSKIIEGGADGEGGKPSSGEGTAGDFEFSSDDLSSLASGWTDASRSEAGEVTRMLMDEDEGDAGDGDRGAVELEQSMVDLEMSSVEVAPPEAIPADELADSGLFDTTGLVVEESVDEAEEGGDSEADESVEGLLSGIESLNSEQARPSGAVDGGAGAATDGGGAGAVGEDPFAGYEEIAVEFADAPSGTEPAAAGAAAEEPETPPSGDAGEQPPAGAVEEGEDSLNLSSIQLSGEDLSVLDDFLDELTGEEAAAPPRSEETPAAGDDAFPDFFEELESLEKGAESAAAGAEASSAQAAPGAADEMDAFLAELESEAQVEAPAGGAGAAPAAGLESGAAEGFDFDDMFPGGGDEGGVPAAEPPSTKAAAEAAPPADSGAAPQGVAGVESSGRSSPPVDAPMRVSAAPDIDAAEIQGLLDSALSSSARREEEAGGASGEESLEEFLEEITADIPTMPSAAVGRGVRFSPEAETAPSAPAGDGGAALAESPVVVESDPSVLLKRFESTTDEDVRYEIVQRLGALHDPGTVSFFIRLLDDHNRDIRECAIEVLGDLGDRSATRPLMKLISLEEPNIRYLCVQALGKIGDPECVDLLVTLLHEPDDNMKYVAVEALGHIGDPKAVRPLMNLAVGADSDLKYAIAEALGRIGSAEATSILLSFLDEEDEEVVLQAVKALGRLRDPSAVPRLIELFERTDKEELLGHIARALGEMEAPQAREHLLRVLSDAGPELAVEVIGALGKIGDAAALDGIVEAMRRLSVPEVERAAVRAIGEIGDEKGVAPLMELMDSGREGLVEAIAEAMGRIRSKLCIPTLTDLLSHADVGIRKLAVEGLGAIEDPSCIEAVARLGGDPAESVREAAARALGRIDTVDSIAPLLRFLADPDERVSEAAVESLLAIGREAVEPVVARFRECDDSMVRRRLVTVMGRSGDVRCIEPLLHAVEDVPRQERSLILDALVQLDNEIVSGESVSIVMKESYAWLRYSMARVLGANNRREALEILLSMIDGTYTPEEMRKLELYPSEGVKNLAAEALSSVRRNAARLMGELDLPDTVRSILARFVEADADVRRWLVFALGFVVKEASVSALVEFLKREDLEVDELEVARSLKRIPLKSVVEKLLEEISTASARARRRMALALGVIGDTRAVPKLSELVSDADEQVRMAALEALGRIGSLMSFEAVASGVKDPSENVRRTAVSVLASMPHDKAVGVLGEALHDRSSQVRVEAARALSSMGGERVVPVLIAGLRDDSSEVRCSIVVTLGKIGDKRAVEPLIQMLKDISPEVRRAAVEALGRIGDPSCVLPLLEAMDDDDLWVKTEAAKTLRALAPTVPKALVDAFAVAGERIRANVVEVLARVQTPQLFQLLLRGLRHRSKYMRAGCAEVLGRWGDKRAVVPLIGLLSDRDFEVREKAAVALGRIGDISATLALKQAQKDQNRSVRLAAAEALRSILERNELEA